MKHSLELTVMMYHYIRDPGDAAEGGSRVPGLPVRVFQAQLDELSKHHTFVSWPDVRLSLEQGRPLPSSACLLTFDDGVRDHYIHVFKILRDRKLSGLFFILDRTDNDRLILGHRIHFLLAKLGLSGLRQGIWEKLDSAAQKRFTQVEKRYLKKYPPTSLERRINLLKAVLQRDLSTHVDSILGELFEAHIGSEIETARQLYLNLEQIDEMAKGGMHFGGHSQSHPWFDWIDAETREQEIKLSSQWLREIEAGPWAFAYPYGGLSEDSPALLKKYGFSAAFTTKAQLRHPNPYFIGRLDGEDVAQVDNHYA